VRGEKKGPNRKGVTWKKRNPRGRVRAGTWGERGRTEGRGMRGEATPQQGLGLEKPRRKRKRSLVKGH